MALRSMFTSTLVLGLLSAAFMLPATALKDGACLLLMLVFLVTYGAGRPLLDLTCLDLLMLVLVAPIRPAIH
jgi:hypothetical protein